MDTEVQPAPEAGAGDDDVRAVVAAAFEQHKEPDTSQAAAPAEADASPERPRNERGQFTQAQEGAEPATPVADTVPDADPAKDTPAQPSNAVEPPTSWSAEAKAAWSSASPALQQAVAKRESEMEAGRLKWSDEKRVFDELLTPVRAASQRAGIDEKEGLKRLLDANAYLERDPQNAIRALAQAYGVDLSKPNGNPTPQPPADPRVSQLHQKFDSLESRIAQREAAETQQTINQFASAPGHEHFEAVKVEMGNLIGAGLATGLQDAYDKAIWANPEVRAKLIAATTATADAAAAEAQRKAKEREAADKAKRAAISPSGAPVANGAPIPQRDFNTVEDAVRAAFRQHAG